MNSPQISSKAAESLELLSLEITGQCNLTCSHCYAESGPRLSLRGDMAKEDWLRVIDEAAEVGCRAVTFIGGEPTLHPDLPAMIERVAGHGFRLIEVFTNATQLKPALLDGFVRHGVSLAASFYSVDPAIHQQITGVAGSWQRTVDGLVAALAAGLEVRIGIVELEANRGHCDAAVLFVQELGVREIRVDRLREVGRGEGATALDEGGERFSELCGHCWEGKLCVTSSGETYPCVFSRRTQLGNAKVGLGTILNEPQLHEFRSKVRQMAGSWQAAANECGPSGSRLPECGPSGSAERDCGPSGLKEQPDCGPSGSKEQPDCGPSGSREQPDCGPSGSRQPACGPSGSRQPACGPSGSTDVGGITDFEVPAGCGPAGSN